jgi:hypothetical protein
MFILTVVRKNAISWYHEYLCHHGSTRTEANIQSKMT